MLARSSAREAGMAVGFRRVRVRHRQAPDLALRARRDRAARRSRSRAGRRRAATRPRRHPAPRRPRGRDRAPARRAAAAASCSSHIHCSKAWKRMASAAVARKPAIAASDGFACPAGQAPRGPCCSDSATKARSPRAPRRPARGRRATAGMVRRQRRERSRQHRALRRPDRGVVHHRAGAQRSEDRRAEVQRRAHRGHVGNLGQRRHVEQHRFEEAAVGGLVGAGAVALRPASAHAAG